MREDAPDPAPEPVEPPRRVRWWLPLLAVLVAGALVAAGFVAGRASVDRRPVAADAPTTSATPSAAPSSPAAADLTVIGDSYTSGSPMDGGRDRRWPALVGQQLDVRVQLLALGGTGYVKASADGVRGTFASRAPQTSPQAKVVVLFGSRNDMSESPAAVQQGATEAIADVRAVNPTATILVVGPPWVNAQPPATLLDTAAAVQAAAQAAGVRWVDPVAEGWLTDGPGLIGTDHVHPTDAGEQELTRRFHALLAPEFR